MIKQLKRGFRQWRAGVLRQRLYARSKPLPIFTGPLTIVAPHPDDETFGCGGLIRTFANAGHDIAIIILTDGEKALSDCTIATTEVATKRRQHVTDAARILGVDSANLHFLQLPDGDIPSHDSVGFPDAVARLRGLLGRHSSEHVFCTHPLEGWADHSAAAQITTQALDELESGHLYYYCVWLWHNLPFSHFSSVLSPPSYYLKLDDVLTAKNSAMDCFFSELAPHINVPYCGRLPEELMANFRMPVEFFFEAMRLTPSTHNPTISDAS